MKGERFLDTNVLVYAFSGDVARGALAKDLLIEGGVIGMQVLNEFTSVAQRKLGWGWPQIEETLAVIADLLGMPRPMTPEIHALAIEVARGHRIAFYDALIVAAARQAGCATLLTEYLQHGRRFGDLTIQNPFPREA